MVAPKRDEALRELTSIEDWKVSTAVVVDGVLRLFSSNARRDTNRMMTPSAQTRSALRSVRDNSPLREIFIRENDTLIYKFVENYVMACNDMFWSTASPQSFILKTVGVQALFDILRRLSPGAMQIKDISTAYFKDKLRGAGDIDFADVQFRVPAGSRRSFIRKTIETAIGI